MRLSFACALLALGLRSGSAWAGDEAPASPAGDSAAGAAAYRQALEQYERGEVRPALASMQESYRLTARAELLYNIARLESELEDCASALTHYREYVAQVPNGRYASAATQASSELAKRCAEPQAPAAAEPQAPAAAEPQAPAAAEPQAPAEPEAAQPAAPAASLALASTEPHDQSASSAWPASRWLGWSAIAAGALAGTGAVYFTFAAKGARDDLQEDIERARAGGPRPEYALEDEQHRDQNWARALAVTSGTLLLGGALLLVFASPPDPASTVTAEIYVQPGLFGAQFSQRF